MKARIRYSSVHEDIEALPPATPAAGLLCRRNPSLRALPRSRSRTGRSHRNKPPRPRPPSDRSTSTSTWAKAWPLRLRRIPAGAFAMGDVAGYGNEFPMTAARVEQPFWLGATEVTLVQYQRFDPTHRNGFYDMHYKDQVRPGYPMDQPDFPVIRVSWRQALDLLPLALATDRQERHSPPPKRNGNGPAAPAPPLPCSTAISTRTSPRSPISLMPRSPSSQSRELTRSRSNIRTNSGIFVPKEARFNDGVMLLAPVGHYRPNAWGLHDMLGNVAEWTLDDYQPAPSASPVSGNPGTIKVVRGGSWADRPKEARASARWDYPAWQQVYNVGFRILVRDP